jgi:hypothetical protein
MSDHDPELEQGFAQLARDLPRVAPPPDLRGRIVAALPAHEAIAVGPWWRRRPQVAIPAAIALAALVAALVIAAVFSGGQDPAVRAALVAHSGSGASGSVELFDPEAHTGQLVLTLRGLPSAPAGEHYTVWVLRAGSTEMTPVASLSQGSTRLVVPLPSPGRYAAVDISEQRDDAPPAHSNHSVAGATLASGT